MAWVARLETAVFGRPSEAAASYGNGFTDLRHGVMPMTVKQATSTSDELAFVERPLLDINSKYEMLNRNGWPKSKWISSFGADGAAHYDNKVVCIAQLHDSQFCKVPPRTVLTL